jgi:hypothetical protein
MDFDKTMSLLSALGRHDVDYVLVGGVAVGLHGLVRATEDVDLFIRPDASNVERLKTALRSVWTDPSIDEIHAEDLLGEYPAVRYGPPDDDLTVDILTRLGEAFGYSDLAVQVIEVDGIEVRLATPATLYRMKRDTVRPLDRQDAQALKERFDLPDEDGPAGGDETCQ